MGCVPALRRKMQVVADATHPSGSDMEYLCRWIVRRRCQGFSSSIATAGLDKIKFPSLNEKYSNNTHFWALFAAFSLPFVFEAFVVSGKNDEQLVRICPTDGLGGHMPG
ncbi:hypothetical protein P691DRAFT_529854 [Macrolepiota fuliginosa MF-IS2]|uniref:Uncharacterized protein n=1 Tax=Macrolepiota fuliginosa MF-IS2 TaxID=1400762 RepID=A0A9P5XNI2_9AGAR|nr:hypothetical protein P691DRAFT_529854 [Macrolepiota fuliginosa MF-IS2]